MSVSLGVAERKRAAAVALSVVQPPTVAWLSMVWYDAKLSNSINVY